MSSRRLLSVLFIVSIFGITSFGQQPGPGDRPDFSKFKEMMDQRMKETMGATDDEWTVLKPKIEKVQKLQRDSAAIGGMMMLFGGGQGGPGGGRGNPFANPDEKPSAIQEKSTDLGKSLQNKDATPDELKAKLAALREARVKSKVEIAKAQDELREVVSVRQEATLVMMGTLD